MLGTVDRIDVEVEVLLLIDKKGLVGVGQDLGRVDVGVFDIVTDGDIADGSNLDGVARLADIAFVVTIANTGLAINE